MKAAGETRNNMDERRGVVQEGACNTCVEGIGMVVCAEGCAGAENGGWEGGVLGAGVVETIRVLGLGWSCRGRGAVREGGAGRCIVGGRLGWGMQLELGGWELSMGEGMTADVAVAAQAPEVRLGVRSVLEFRGLYLYCTTKRK